MKIGMEAQTDSTGVFDNTTVIRPMPLNRDIGLENTGGDTDLYNQLLQSFLRDHKNDISSINAAFDSEDFNSAVRIVHTLKSTAALIGALVLQKAALFLEKTIKETNHCNAEEFESLKKALDDVFSELGGHGLDIQTTGGESGA